MPPRYILQPVAAQIRDYENRTAEAIAQWTEVRAQLNRALTDGVEVC